MKENNRNILIKILEILLAIAPIFSIRMQLDTDTWFMLSHGRYIVENGFPTKEILTVHSDFDFQIQKWATCVIFYLIYKVLDYAGILLFIYIVTALTELVMFITLKKISNNTFASILITSITMFFMNFAFARTRPQVFSYLFIMLEILILEKYVREDNKKALAFLPVISFFYIQLHSTQWIMMLIIMSCYLFDTKLVKIRRIVPGEYKKAPILLAAGASVVTALANPYGYKTFVYIYESLSDSRHLENIQECQPTTIHALWILVPSLIMVIYKLWQGKRVSLRFMYLMLGTFIMALMARRNEAYTLLGFAIGLAELWGDFNILEDKKTLDIVLIPCILGCFVAILIGIEGIASADFYSRNDKYVKDAFDVMAENVEPSKDVKVFTTFNTGGYAEWLGYTGYMDARSEVFSEKVNHKAQVYDELNSLEDQANLPSFQEKYRFDYYIVGNGTTLYRNIKANGYQNMYQNEVYTIFAAN